MKYFLFSLFIVLAATDALAVKYSYTTTPSKLKDFTVTCGTSATEITASGITTLTQVVCQNLSATPIYIGNATLGTAFPICNDTGVCGYNVFPIPAKHPYCKVATGSAVLGCLAVYE